ncbi:MAG: hypothetical protein JNK58_12955 [Phycisphaerae bacterium]|nr:hypothetical protein [Phycisphaerae bacterium]
MGRLTIAEGVHIASLGLWIGTLVMAGLTAAIAFPTMKRLDPSLPGFPAAAAGDHWSIAAGHIANPVLTVGVCTQAVLAVLAIVTLFRAAGARGWQTYARRACVVLASVLAMLLFALVVGKMRPAIAEYWHAAQAGDAAAARERKAHFDAMHPSSSRLMGATVALASVALVLAIVDRRSKEVDFPGKGT